jgi:hypothetical protein
MKARIRGWDRTAVNEQPIAGPDPGDSTIQDAIGPRVKQANAWPSVGIHIAESGAQFGSLQSIFSNKCCILSFLWNRKALLARGTFTVRWVCRRFGSTHTLLPGGEPLACWPPAHYLKLRGCFQSFVVGIGFGRLPNMDRPNWVSVLHWVNLGAGSHT